MEDSDKLMNLIQKMSKAQLRQLTRFAEFILLEDEPDDLNDRGDMRTRYATFKDVRCDSRSGGHRRVGQIERPRNDRAARWRWARRRRIAISSRDGARRAQAVVIDPGWDADRHSGGSPIG